MKGQILRFLAFFFLKAVLLSSCICCKCQNIQNLKIREVWKILDKEQASNLVIAIIDGGVLTSHENFKGQIWMNQKEIINNNLDDDGNGYIDDYYGWNFQSSTNDVGNGGLGNWHGTPVNGIINTIGNHPWNNIELLNLVKADSVLSIIESLRYVYKMRKLYNRTNGSRGAFIVTINCSWGREGLSSEDYPEWCAIYDSLGAEGILTVHSVPNQNINIDSVKDMPSDCSSDYLVTVTNTSTNGDKIYDSAYGSISVDIGAPGENTYTTLNTGDNGYFGGTSAAAPYVTAVIGLLYSLPSPGLKSQLISSPHKVALLMKSAIIESAAKTNSLEKTVSGGMISAFKAAQYIFDYYGESHLYQNLFEGPYLTSIYPNPVEETATLIIESDETKDVELDLVRTSGKIIQQYTLRVKAGIQEIKLDLSEIENGSYLIYSPDANGSLKILKK